MHTIVHPVMHENFPMNVMFAAANTSWREVLINQIPPSNF
jgi:hypothetical protein